MISVAHLTAFAITAFVIIVIPGPSVMFIIGRALSQGRKAALLSVAGNTLGEYLQVVAISLGIGTLAEHSVTIFTDLKIFGSIYLLYLGIKTMRNRRSPLATRFPSIQGRSRYRQFFQGTLVGVTNPKTVVFLAAILPEFTSKADGSIPSQMLLLGAVFSAIALASDSVWALAADMARVWLTKSNKGLRLVKYTGGLAIVGAGVGLAIAGRNN